SIDHRDVEIKNIVNILAPSLRLEKPSNIFIYGKTGTGKTLSIKYVLNHINETAQKRDIPIKTIYLNCKLKKIADTEYRVVAQLASEFGKEIPATGLPTDEVYRIFFTTLDSRKQIVLIVLDEIDQLVKKGGAEILYNLTRINEELKNAQLSLVGISNDLLFADSLDPRIKSSLSEEEILFPPYNALQIKNILTQRAKLAFKEDVLETGLVEKCAAYAAREHGDARRALELLRVAGELAERENNKKVLIKHLDVAEEKIERDRLFDIIVTQPKQHQAVLYSVLAQNTDKKNTTFTGDVYDVYKKLCTKTGLRPLTQRRVGDVIAELDMLGILQTHVISKGRYGRTREICVSIPSSSKENIMKILEESVGL
ncbi:orc1/cdc6 family replication initiation protein, partial [Candidatus Woesearchaeota archaeon]|nr:orc1/cdc6 family replication initiation protein [Candidatus Woesearchaeota archaeon]